LRNILIAIGNAGPNHPELSAAAARHLDDGAPLVRATAAWALSRVSPSRFRNERKLRLGIEPDELVRAEWEREPDAA
jgi:epoxyqueuosine reductase